jgi:glycosyltransferase involved in cell wall biosynthesis
MSMLRDMFFMATSWLTRHPCIGHVHGSGFRKAYESLSQPLQRIEKFLVGRLNAAVVLSDSLKQMFAGILDDSRVFAVPNGIDPEFVLMAEESICRRFDQPKFDILFLSNLISAKGFSTLLKTAVIAQERGCNWHFRFVGARVPNQDVDIDDFVHEHRLRNVTIDGVLEGRAKHEAYRDADVFVLPSEYEGQPLCILEAMFESLPVVTTRVGGIPDIFSPDESSVEYIEPNDPEALYKALDVLYHSPERRQTMSKQGREIALSRFTADHHIEEMIKLFDRACL